MNAFREFYEKEVAPAMQAKFSYKNVMEIPKLEKIDRLFSMLPYKSLSFSAMEGKHGVYALISKDENRDRSIKKPRPSLRAQLEADKAKTTPKKAAAKSKNHEMEV